MLFLTIVAFIQKLDSSFQNSISSVGRDGGSVGFSRSSRGLLLKAPVSPPLFIMCAKV